MDGAYYESIRFNDYFYVQYSFFDMFRMLEAVSIVTFFIVG